MTAPSLQNHAPMPRIVAVCGGDAGVAVPSVARFAATGYRTRGIARRDDIRRGTLGSSGGHRRLAALRPVIGPIDADTGQPAGARHPSDGAA